MLTVDELHARLKSRFCMPEWIYIREVRSTLGYSSAVTYADGMAVNLYPSRGCEVHGFELKTNRDDVLKEFRNLKKSENIQGYCDRWWLVVGDKTIVNIAELPPYWGLLIPYGQGLRQVRAAPKREAETWTRGFLVSLFKKIYVNSPVGAQLHAEYERGKKDGITQGQLPQKDLMVRVNNILEQVKRFEEISGIEISTYNGRSLGEAVEIVRDATRIGMHIRDLENTEREHNRIAKAAKEAAENLRKLLNESQTKSKGVVSDRR